MLGDEAMMLRHLRWLVDFIGVPLSEIKADENLETRLKIQKAVYLLNTLGVAPFTSYEFNMYLRGPYSPVLAKHYYLLDENVSPVEVDIDEEKKRLLRWFVSKTPRWLEIASSIISLRRAYRRMQSDGIYSLIRLSKPWVELSKFRKIYQELESQKLI